MALLASKDKLDLRHVAYRGGHPAVTDTIGGHVPLVVVNALEAAPYIRDNKLKGLGTTGPKRLQALPDLATVAEAPGLASYAAETWWGLFAPAGTPQPVLERLEREVHKALADPALRKRIEDVGGSVKPSSRAELAAFVRSERAKWKEVVQATGLKAN